MSLRVGSVLAGRYEITAPIATGGMGEVWRAVDRVLDRTVAAKVLKAEFTGDPSFLTRFRNEARHTAALTHPNIASVYDYGETDSEGRSLAYLVMEYVEGEPLVTILAQEGRLSPERALDVLGQAADGLSAAHRAGVVHRDIKPGNLIVRPDGVVKLTDFGIARARDATPLTRTGMVVGTAQYLSPEQAQGYEVTPASDVYSLGVLGYECLTGYRPFDGDSQVAIALAQVSRPPPPLPPDVPPSVRALIDRALAKDPRARFPDGAAFGAAVRDVAAGRPLPMAGGTTQLAGSFGNDEQTRMFPATSPGAAVGAYAADPTRSPRTMPPLHGQPADDPDGYDDDRSPDRRRRVLAWVISAVAVLALLGGGIAYGLGQTDDGGGSGTGGGTTTTTAPTLTTAPTSDPAPGQTDGEPEETTAEQTSEEPPPATTEAPPPATTTEAPATTTEAPPSTTAATTTAPTTTRSGGSATATQPGPTTRATPTTSVRPPTPPTTTAPPSSTEPVGTTAPASGSVDEGDQ
jgi:serine/threonine-protein kinase